MFIVRELRSTRPAAVITRPGRLTGMTLSCEKGLTSASVSVLAGAYEIAKVDVRIGRPATVHLPVNDEAFFRPIAIRLNNPEACRDGVVVAEISMEEVQ